jgi:aryl-alcohol dehydrogenase-like predicted oxidoreductase
MRYTALGQSGIEASTVAFGAWAVGGWWWGGADDSDSVAAIRRGLDLGMNFVDTAPIYGKGRSEEVVGKAIKGCRAEVILATKCGLVWWDDTKGAHFFTEEGSPVHRYLGAGSIRHELEQSLRRLQTDYIDLYQTHWQDATTPIAETMGVLLELKQEGKIRAIGVSNATVAEMDEYRKAGPIDADQERYSMLARKMEDGQLAYCDRENIAVLAYSPLAQGLLTGKVTADRELPEGDLRAGDPWFKVENRARILAFLEEIRPIAEERGATLAQLALAWTLGRPGLTHALAGARNPAQVEENEGAAAVDLSAEEIAQIDESLVGLKLEL